ncbi:penicillin-binding protein 1B [Gilvimarinus sp. F26214L]|uniref:penicillin-binding protein 1B n=1 Tax=Gilvimarinus sp. DZF01 TaxID=3461371 RepID=UPI004045B3A4
MARRTTRKSRKAPSRRTKSTSGLLGGLRRWWKLALIPVFLGLGTLLYLDYVVRSKFEGKKWSLPARVYARPLELYAGLPLKQDELLAELEGLGYQFVNAVNKPGQASVRGDRVQLHSRGFTFWDRREPAQYLSLSFANGSVQELSDRSGAPLPIVRLEPQEIGGIYPAHMEDRLLLRLEDVPPLLGETLIAVEDRDFIRHHGVSPKSIARAAYVNMRAGRVVQGGSTLTQQLVKNFYLDQRRSMTRKIVEAFMAISLDARYSKAEILETYLNEVYLGQSGPRAIHGFALGAQHYFRQPLGELRIHQIALLVGLVKGASYYNPWRHPERALERRNVVLSVMEERGLISEFEAQIARQQPLDVVQGANATPYSYPAFIELVKRQLQRDYRQEDLRSEGLRVFTTLSPTVQKAAEESLQSELTAMERGYELEAETLQGAVVVEAVGSGEVLAVVGDRDPDYAGFNRALDARRAIGSLVKPAVYLTALMPPENYTLISPIDDSALSVESEGGRLWEPRNFSREEHGEVPLYQALAKSYNQATARLGMELGVEPVRETLRKLGVDEPIAPLPSLFLGALDLSPLQVSAMYQTIASEGVYTPQRSILSVLDAQGQPLNRYPLLTEERFPADAMHLLQYGLQATMREGTGRSAYQRLDESWQVAGKTGTSNEQRDSWFAGYSGDHLAVVWVGRDDNGPTPLTGATGALRVWTDVFGEISSRPLSPLKPAGVDYHWVNPADGTLGGSNCIGSELLPFLQGTEPQSKGGCRHRRNPVIHWLQQLWDTQ